MEKAIWVKCKGEAHGNPYIDNCWFCAPFWEEYPICPANHANPVKLTEKGYCWVCARHFDISEKHFPINRLRLFEGAEGIVLRKYADFAASAGKSAAALSVLRGRLK